MMTNAHTVDVNNRPTRRRTDVLTRVLPRLAWRDDLPPLSDDLEEALEARAVFPMELRNR